MDKVVAEIVPDTQPRNLPCVFNNLQQMVISLSNSMALQAREAVVNSLRMVLAPDARTQREADSSWNVRRLVPVAIADRPKPALIVNDVRLGSRNDISVVRRGATPALSRALDHKRHHVRALARRADLIHGTLSG